MERFSILSVRLGVFLILTFALVLAFVPVSLSAQNTDSSSSVGATGHVFSVNSTELKIIRPDGSKVNGLRGDNPYVNFEFDKATVGRIAWGRVSCTGGICTWTCLDTVPSCSSFFDVTLTGPVVAKDLCAGVLYVTIDDGQGLIRSRCEGADGYAECNALDLGQEVEAVITVGCGDGKWKSFIEQ